MKNGISWMLISCLIALVTVLASCGPATTTPTVAPTTVPGTVTQTVTPTTAAQTTSVAPTTTSLTEVPKYGGVLRILWKADTLGFDDLVQSNSNGYTLQLTHEELWQGDWAKGPAGTNEVTWAVLGIEAYPAKYSTGVLAESWEMSGAKNENLIFHIRKGVYWHNKPPTNGRELVADDVVFSFSRAWANPLSVLGRLTKPPISIEATDKYTVLIKYASFTESIMGIREVTDFQSVWPRDAVEANKNDMRDWKVSIGTGPFILTDYVKASSMTLVRNSNYWGKDPVGPGKGNQLPYLDGVKILVIPDVSTLVTAMRTGKGDRAVFGREDTASLQKTNPELIWSKALPITSDGAYFIAFRLDNPAIFSDIKIRQALHMSIDYQAIVDGYYGGDAVVYNFPAPANVESRDFFTPLNQLPQNVQNLFKYQPDKAKQMIAEAGYPKGFDLEVVCRTTDVDLLSIYKEYWAKIGVNLIIAPKEYAVWNSARVGKGYKETIFCQTSMNLPLPMEDFRIGRNMSYITDSRVEEIRNKSFAAFWDWNERCRLFKEINPYLLELCWFIPSPSFYSYTMWQPWLKNYHGEESNGNNNRFQWARWVWLDQDLKEKMMGTR
jgi:peptide/nickel transport system substrate-binding protein